MTPSRHVSTLTCTGWPRPMRPSRERKHEVDPAHLADVVADRDDPGAGAGVLPAYTWTNFASAAIFGLAAITDWLDGWIARRYQLESAFGAFLDPVADKLMVAVALFLIVQGHPTPWMAFWAAVIVGRGSRYRRCANGWPSWASAPGARWKIKTTARRAAVPAVFGGTERAGGRHLDGLAGVPHRRLDPGDCRRADPVVGPAVPARGLAEPAR